MIMPWLTTKWIWAVKRIERIIESEHLRVPRVIDRYKGMLASADLAR